MEKLTYEEAYELVKEEIQKALTRSPRIINEYLTHLSASQGKMIRAVSVLTCAGDGEGKIAPGAVHAAAAIEIVHLASLVHDDIIDNADLRRGRETLQKKYGKRTAVICGDYLLSLALKMLSAIPDRKEYTDIDLPDYISRLCLGELLQHINNRNLDLTVFDYIRIISGKTAALFEASFFAGAVLGGSAAEEIKKYKKIGNYTGLIFQLRDDCLDFDKTVEEAKKPVQSDYEQGVVTLPLIRALEKQPGFKKKAEAGEIVRAEINRAVEEAGGLDYTREMIERYYKKAKRYIDKLDVTEEKRTKLAAIVKKAAGIKADD
ncbi:polyprenyl synthetase family protein [Kineothrix sedimenti]|uniref:Polyprenyl synthetase family protein n=1 Tax=Kineothrix sedimenti TaxID=3123317 RepID=A0ABZ3F1L1_9FIRM